MDLDSRATGGKNHQRTVNGGSILSANFDLVFVFLWTFATVLFVLTPASIFFIARAVAGLVFVFLVPSYAFVAVLFPQHNISGFERAMLVLGLSFPMISLFCFGLDFSQLGVQLDTVVASTAGFTVLCAIVAGIRRSFAPAEKRFSIAFGALFRLKRAVLPTSEGRVDKTLSIALIVSIIVAVSVLTFAAVSPKQGERFTDFYLLGSTGQAGYYPTEYRLGEQKTITLGVVNHEYRTQTYNRVVNLTNGTLSTTLYTDQVVLAHNQTLETPINIKPNLVGNNQKLEFLLYVDNRSIPYRENHLWVSVTR